jgi:hypothetical protein
MRIADIPYINIAGQDCKFYVHAPKNRAVPLFNFHDINKKLFQPNWTKNKEMRAS